MVAEPVAVKATVLPIHTLVALATMPIDNWLPMVMVAVVLGQGLPPAE